MYMQMYRSTVLLTLPLSADNVMLDWGVKCVCVCNTYYYYEGNEGTYTNMTVEKN